MKIFKNKLLLSVLFVLLIIVIPSFIFSIYQYSTVTNEEQVIDDVYKNQLESILFSINQYSVDIVDTWVNKLDVTYESEESNLDSFLMQNNQIQQINIIRINDLNQEVVAASKLSNSHHITSIIKDYIKNHTEEIKGLGEYLESDYQKVIGVQQVYEPDLTFLLFRLKENKEQLLGIFTIKTEKFILEYLSPKTQQIAEDKMNIVVYHRNQERIIYANHPVEKMDEIQKSKTLWLFPEYSVGIKLIGKTLNDLVKKRVQTVVLLVIIFNVLIIFGIWLLYHNIKREIELAKIKSDFVSNVSHELRTPLAMISMYSETLLLDRVKNDEKRKEYYEIINQETTRLNGIVNNILNFSRIENKKRRYTFSVSNLNEIVEEVLKVYKYELLNKGFTYKFSALQNVKLISVDRDAVKDAIINLISNAIKYSDQHKEIEIIIGEDSKHLFIEIADKGIGISEKDQKLIFDKFYRVTDGNLAYKAQGSGLGLSIVKHIVDAHNGKIEIESSLNQGSRFKLFFPKN